MHLSQIVVHEVINKSILLLHSALLYTVLYDLCISVIGVHLLQTQIHCSETIK